MSPYEEWLSVAEHDTPGQKTEQWPPPEPEDIEGGQQQVECLYCSSVHIVSQAMCVWTWENVTEVRELKRPSQFYCLNPEEVRLYCMCYGKCGLVHHWLSLAQKIPHPNTCASSIGGT